MKIMNNALNKIKKLIGKYKIETPKNIRIAEFICLVSKAYSFKCKDDNESKNKLKGTSKSQSKRIKFKEFEKCLEGDDYQKQSDNFIFRSISQEMYLQKVKKYYTSSI